MQCLLLFARYHTVCLLGNIFDGLLHTYPQMVKELLGHPRVKTACTSPSWSVLPNTVSNPPIPRICIPSVFWPLLCALVPNEAKAQTSPNRDLGSLLPSQPLPSSVISTNSSNVRLPCCLAYNPFQTGRHLLLTHTLSSCCKYLSVAPVWNLSMSINHHAT